MPNSTLTDDELSLSICEFLEPKPNYDNADQTESPFKFWYRSDAMNTGKTPRWWQHRSMVHDPEMTLLLMKRDQFVDVSLDEGVYRATFCKAKVHDPDCHEFVQAENSDLGRCIAEAFAHANNLIPKAE